MAKIKFYTHIHNAAKWFPSLAKRMLKQTFVDFEWVIRDNASDDGTTDILREFADTDTRIFPIFGASNDLQYSASLRGKLTDCSKHGADYEYFGIIDGDDLVTRDYAAHLYDTAATNNAEFVCASYIMFADGDDSLTSIRDGKSVPQVINGKKVERGDHFQQNLYQIFPPWCKLWTKGLVMRTVDDIDGLKKLYYPDGNVPFNSDALDNLALLTHSEKTVFTDRVIYYYRQTGTTFSRKLPDEGYIKTVDYIREMTVVAEKHFGVYVSPMYSDYRCLEQLARIIMHAAETESADVTAFERAKCAFNCIQNRIFNSPKQRKNALPFVERIYDDFVATIDYNDLEQSAIAISLDSFIRGK